MCVKFSEEMTHRLGPLSFHLTCQGGLAHLPWAKNGDHLEVGQVDLLVVDDGPACAIEWKCHS